MSFKTVLLKLRSAVQYRAAEVCLPGRGIVKFVSYNRFTAFMSRALELRNELAVFMQ